MPEKGKNFNAGTWKPDASTGKVFLGELLGLTGSEMSLGFLPRGTGQPFVHSHKRNEETYIVVAGAGLMHIDGVEIPLEAGSVVRVASAGKRALKAADSSDLAFYCIQTDTGSLLQATADDGVIETHPTSWLAGK